MSQQDEWKEELERELKKVTRGKDKSLHLKAKDFPCLVDGLLYESLQEYVELNRTTKRQPIPFEMSGTDQQTSFDYGYSPKWNRNRGSSYSPQKALPPAPAPLPKIELKAGKHRIVDIVAHMHYIVYRTKEAYFAVWLSLSPKDKLEECIAALKDVKFPSGVTSIQNSLMHTSKKRPTFRTAEDFFFKGSESPSRIRERMKKACRPDYIPPNLRKMAIAATFDNEVWDCIPKSEHEILLKWLKAGCPGWYGKDPSKDWCRANGVKLKRNHYQGSTSAPAPKPPVGQGDRVWDFKNNCWKWMD